MAAATEATVPLAKRTERYGELAFRRAAAHLSADSAASASKYPLILTAFLRKALKTHRALSLLVRARFGEDAEILLRSTYEMWVAAHYISLAPQERADQYFGHMPRGQATQLERVLGAMSAFPRVRQALAVNTHALQVDRDTLAQAAQHSPHRFRWAKDTEGNLLELDGMVKEIGAHCPHLLTTELHHLAYGNLSMRAHTDPACLAEYFKIAPDGRVSFPELKGESASHALATSGQLLLGIASLLAEELQLPIRTALARLEAEYLRSIPALAATN